MGEEHCFQLHNLLIWFFDWCYFMKKSRKIVKVMFQASHFCTYFSCFPAIFTDLCFHLLKSSETDSRGKYLQCRSAPLQKWLKTWLFWRTPFPAFVFRSLLANTPFMLEVQCYDTICIGAGSGQTSTDFSSSKLNLFLSTFVPPPLTFSSCTAPSVRGA